MTSIQTISAYVKGTNEYLDKIYDADTDGPLWVIQGSTGRRPVLAEGEAEAVADYKKRERGHGPDKVDVL